MRKLFSYLECDHIVAFYRRYWQNMMAYWHVVTCKCRREGAWEASNLASPRILHVNVTPKTLILRFLTRHRVKGLCREGFMALLGHYVEFSMLKFGPSVSTKGPPLTYFGIGRTAKLSKYNTMRLSQYIAYRLGYIV